MTPLKNIFVPDPKKPETYQKETFGQHVEFVGLKRLLGAADIAKAGDKNAGLCATSEVEREAARALLSELSLEHLYDHPLTDNEGKIDEVMRVNYDIDRSQYEKIKHLKLGELKNRLLSAPGEDIASLGLGLTGVMAAAITKLLDTHELVFIAKKIQRPSKARTLLGTKGTLSSRLQPNHPIDDLRGISLLTYLGLSMGSGDALIGVNPAIDTVENISKILVHLDKLRQHTQAPTQICVLAHVKTQMQCLAQGAPVEIMFQSLAGTESTLLTEFDVSVSVLDEAYLMMREKGPLKDEAKQFMYFETGQGSEFTYQKHNDTDMATLEALCYGLARRYDPFMVNNVTGFIGPETHLDNFEMIYSSLQDHFMGKLLGLPMGMAPCYTLHSEIGLEGQQMATQMLTAAGANYYMDVYLNTDRMLAYFDTSAHDNQTLREIYDKEVTPEFKAWAVEKEIFKLDEQGNLSRGSNWGRPEIFCSNDAELAELKSATPSLYGMQNKGPRPQAETSREIRYHQAVGRQAIYSELDAPLINSLDTFLWVSTGATDRASHLNSPDQGSYLSKESLKQLKQGKADVQVVLSDGLSAQAVNHNIEALYPVLSDGLKAQGYQVGPPLVAPFGRVKLAENIATHTQTKLVLLLIGERPGGNAQAASSLSAYFAYQLLNKDDQAKAAEFSGSPNIAFEYTVLSNIYSHGLPPLEAGSVLAEKVNLILKHRAAGNRLEKLLN